MGDDFDLSGRRALVTGSSRGLGAFVAEGLARAGAHVIVHGRGREGAERAAGHLRDLGYSVESIAFDVSDPSAVARHVGELIETSGPPDILVNNAGINLRHPLTEFPRDDWHSVVATHLHAAYYLAQATVGPMLEAGRGKIINMCSLAGSVTRPGISAYSAAKGGLEMLTKSMAVEWGASGVTTNGIAPGFFATDMNKKLVEDPKFNDWVVSRTAVRRWGRPEDIAGVAVFLASPASDYVNGHILTVDGGFLAAM